MEFKICNICNTNKLLTDFAKCSRDGHQARCKACQSIWRKKNKDKMNSYKAKYRKSNREKLRQSHIEYHKNNKEKEKLYRQNYYSNPSKKGLRLGLRAKRRAIKKNAVPKWANLKTINEFYKNCPEGYHVDHIVPLQHSEVCGLHVLENLQYLSAHDNLSKSNKFDGTLENNSWRN